jgi:hypothetical protein
MKLIDIIKEREKTGIVKTVISEAPKAKKSETAQPIEFSDDADFNLWLKDYGKRNPHSFNKITNLH